jgi:folate-dependent phosphoribosylglycinamide formyltransferase PurN
MVKHGPATCGVLYPYPGWRIWYVPHSGDGGATWCAQRLPTLNEDSPERLAEAITEVERDAEP